MSTERGPAAAATLRLKKREERRLKAGHLWIFSNEIDTTATPLKGISPGSPVTIESSTGQFLAHAYANPASLISARVLSRTSGQRFDATLLRARIKSAEKFRTRRYPEKCYRLIHGEGDLLPGLVVDRYGDVLVVQITTAGMELWCDEIIEALNELCQPTAVLLANDTPVRALEGLQAYRKWVIGEDGTTLRVSENGLSHEVPPELSQKTGWFYDHRESRWRLRNWVKGQRVLDVYSYLGGFGLNAAAAGASQVIAIDGSAAAVEQANRNAALNGLQSGFLATKGDAVQAMRTLADEGEQFDVVVIDPPAFIKRRKDKEAGTQQYALNNRLAMRLLKPGGILLSASCSQALDDEALLNIIRRNVPRSSEGLQILDRVCQGPDHPANPSMPETSYLGGFVARLM